MSSLPFQLSLVTWERHSLELLAGEDLEKTRSSTPSVLVALRQPVGYMFSLTARTHLCAMADILSI